MNNEINDALIKLDELADAFLVIQADHKDSTVKYSDHTVMNAVIVFNAIIGNVAIHRMMEKETSLEAGRNVIQELGEILHKLILTWTGVNTKTFYD